MFQFGLFSMNIVYVAFAAIYLVSFGLLSYNRLEAKKQNDNSVKEDQEKTISYHSGTEEKNPTSFHYSDYFTGNAVKAPAHNHSLNKTRVLLFHDEIPDHLLYFSILSRPPPADK